MLFRKKVNELEIFKCAQGDIVPIENVPDSVFADKLLGDGIESTLVMEKLFHLLTDKLL